MLPFQHKVTKKREVEVLAQKGRRVTSAFFIVKFRANKLGLNRFILVVSGKVHKRAVKRNRLRRRMREIVRLHLMNTVDACDVMIIAKAEALTATYRELEKDLCTLYKRGSQHSHLAHNKPASSRRTTI